MRQEELQESIERLKASISPELVKRSMDRLLAMEGEELGGGVNAMHLVRYLLGEPELTDAQLVWACDSVKSGLGDCIEQVPSLYYFSGD